MRISLLAHNGVFGSNTVKPFAGAILPATSENPISYEGREFSLAFIENEGTPEETHCFREIAFGEPSDWAKAKAAEKAARNG